MDERAQVLEESRDEPRGRAEHDLRQADRCEHPTGIRNASSNGGR
jgi:hypothetical protein